MTFRWGYDIFICYNRQSALSYVQKLYESLTGKPHGLVCFLDEAGFTPGASHRRSGAFALSITYMLIVVFTKEAMRSTEVQLEVNRFLRLRRFFRGKRISILDLNGDW